MAINLEKSVKNVKVVLDKIGFDQKVQVVLALDISGSMTYAFNDGSVQELVERLLAIGINMDHNEEIDVYLFNGSAKFGGTANRDNIDGFVKNQILSKNQISGGTNYAPVMQEIAKDYNHLSSISTSSTKPGLLQRLFGAKSEETVTTTIANGEDTVVVFFVTDGANMDEGATERFVKEISNKPIFWQFIGIDGSSFPFLEQLDEMRGRVIDNANFFDAGDIYNISDDELYNRILVELPSWHKEATKKGIIK